MMNAPPDEVSGIFELHQHYINTLVRISISPHITHVDRLRTENQTPDHPKMERSTRQWASSLQDGNGNSLQCDVDSGSHNRQVYLMVPNHHEAQARTEITSYLSRLANLRTSTVLNFTPNAAIITNVEFLRTMAQSKQWSPSPAFPAPSPLRNPASALPAASTHTSTQVQQRDQSASIGTSVAPSQQTPLSKYNYARRHSADDQATATTFASDNQTARFNAMEADILKHQTALQQHQSAFKSVHARFDAVEDKAIRTMEVCQASSKSILDLRQDSFQQMTSLRSETAQSIQTLREESTASQINIQSQLASLQELMRSLLPNTPNLSTGITQHLPIFVSQSTQPMHTSLQLAVQSSPAPSDTKKRDADAISEPDQGSAPYKSPRAPDGSST